MGLCIELCAQAVRTPLNYTESPPAKFQYNAYAATEDLSVAEISPAHTVDSSGGREPAGRGVNRTRSFDEAGTRRSFWNRNNKKHDTLVFFGIKKDRFLGFLVFVLAAKIFLLSFAHNLYKPY